MPIGAAWQTLLETPLINIMVGLSALAFGSYGLAISGAGFAEGMQWGVPWVDVVGVAALALAASGIAALWPARRASRILPAEALRVAD